MYRKHASTLRKVSNIARLVGDSRNFNVSYCAWAWRKVSNKSRLIASTRKHYTNKSKRVYQITLQNDAVLGFVTLSIPLRGYIPCFQPSKSDD